jgi:eukaryotic-like serine/threonine-protein kinase
MIRCPTCGRRIRDAAPVCPAHGPPPPAPPPSEEKTTPFVVPPPDLPTFRVVKTLGQGGFGAVFLAHRASDGQPVAIKVARADNASAGEALLREADALAAVGVPHVPAVFDRGLLKNGSAYVVMEFVKAEVLSERLAALEGPMEIDEFSRHALAILNVIEIAHGRNLVHCDLKPENVFIDEKLGAKLFDFGLVRKLGAQRIETTKEEAPAGTPEYMSPEQCEARTDIDARSDIYALGVMFYEMLVGGPPFWGNSAEVQQNHRSRRPPPLSRRMPVAVALEEAIMRCLAKDPDRRFASATELRRALQAGLVAERARREGTAAQPAAAGAGAAAGDAAKPGNKPAAAARERRVVALLFFESKSNVAVIREAGNGVGAQLAHTAGVQYVLAFGHEVGDNPTRAAATAGEMFIARGLAKAVLVDLTSVSVQARPDGSRRYQSPLFSKKEQYPGEADLPGVLLSPAAAEVLPDAPSEEVGNRPGFMRLHKATQASERTTTRMGVAPLVGRDELLRTLIDLARGTVGGAGPTITTLLGEPGHGKSHLAQMLVQHLEVSARMQTIFVRAKDVLGGVGEQTTRELLQRTLSLPDEAPADLGRALLAEELGSETSAEVWGGVAVAMAWAPPEHPELRSLAAAPGALRSATARALGEALRRSSRAKPLALVIEDAHFVDETALDAIEYATLVEASCPMWVCVVGRPAFGRGRTAWASRAAKHQQITLPPLDTAAAIELARRLLSPAENVPQSALARLAERTLGVPMLLVELVRGLKRDGLVRKSEKGQGWYLATDELERLPDLPLVQWLSSRETESLPPDLLAHARLASVLGVEFSSEEIEGVLQELERSGGGVDTQLDAGIGVRRLIESGILARHRGGRVGFRHSLLRDTVYQSVPQTQREAIHHAAFDYFRRHDQLPEMGRLPQMAFHAARSGLKEEAGKLYLDLAGRTAARHAYLDAELLYKHALDNFSDANVDALIAAGQGRGLMRFRLGRHEDALKDFTAAIERARQADRPAAVIGLLLDEGIVLDWTGDWPRSRVVSEEAVSIAAAHEEVRTPLVHARLLMAQARSLLRAEKVPEALDLLRVAVKAAEPLGDEGYEPYTQSLVMVGYAGGILNRFDEAEAALDRCLEVYEAHGDMVGIGGVLQNRALTSFLTNRIDRVLTDFKRIIQIAREYGFVMSESTALRDLGEVYFMIGQPEDAEPYTRRAIDMFKRTVGEGSRSESCEALLVRLKWYAGDPEAAGELLRALVARQTEAEASGRASGLLLTVERLVVDGVGLALRGAADAEFDALIGKGRELSMQAQDIVELMEMKALSALRGGRREDGIRLLEEALAEADRNARLVSDRVKRQLERATAASPLAARRG